MMNSRTIEREAEAGMMREAMAKYVDRGEIAGIVALVARGDDVEVVEVGTVGIGRAAPVRRDTIFRVSSMTKPLTAAAAMMLVEDSKLVLDEPVDRLLPELASRRVLRRIDAPLDDTVPAKRPITVFDVLTFTMGFGFVMVPPDTYPIQRAVTELGIATLGPPAPAVPPAPDEWMRRFATLPLMHQPGERWMYNTSAHVLGVLVARAARQSLDVFMRERLFEPLGMKDTAFFVPANKRERFVTSYMVDRLTNELVVYDAADGQWSTPPAFPDGASGIVSTADDFLAFGRMILGKGKYGARRVLSEASVAAMTTDHITPAQKAISDYVPGFWETRGWGFGGCVITKGDEITKAPGRYGWDGGLGTSWYADPAADLTGVLMTQRAWASPSPPPVHRDFWRAAYGK